LTNRFSQENIDKLVVDKTDSGFSKIFKGIICVTILDFAPEFGILLWTDLFLIFKFNEILFLIGFLSLLIWSFFWIYFVFIKYYIIKVNNYSIKLEKSELKTSIKFGFVTDIHIGKKYYGTNLGRLKLIIKKINAQNFDLIALGGDFVCEAVDRK